MDNINVETFNFQSNLDENIELKKAVAKLEELYAKEKKEAKTDHGILCHRNS